MLDEIHQQFIEVVRQGRGKRLKETPGDVQRPDLDRPEEHRAGPRRRLGSVDYVAREVIKAEDVVDFTPKDSFIEQLSDRSARDAGEALARGVRKRPRARWTASLGR